MRMHFPRVTAGNGRATWLFIVSAIFTVPAAAQEPAGPRSLDARSLLVANRSSHEVTFVDLSSGKIVARLPTGKGPHLLSNVSDGRVMATGYGDFPKPHAKPVAKRPPFVESPNSRLTLIDIESRGVVLDRVIEGCTKPHASWIIGDRAYVTCETEQQLLALDLENGEVMRSFDTRQKGSHVLAYAEMTRTLAVSNTGSASLTLINIDSSETNVVEVGKGSEGLRLIGNQFWVGNAWEGSISIVDARKQTVIETTEPLCDFPIAFGERMEQVWVACFGSAELLSINRNTYSLARRIELEDQPLNLIIHPELAIAYVSLPRMNAVAEIDLETGTELRRIEVGIEPDGLRWAE